MSFLFFTQNIVDAMAGSKNWEQAAQNYNNYKLHADINKMVADFKNASRIVSPIKVVDLKMS